ncbi:MAG TPA: FAD-dependent oxidoreductase [Saprospiraceae bacterium]|nr:FAD-dependent oxidoreductase [Saprospiraceae bacterium]
MAVSWYDAELIGQKVEATGINRFWFQIKSDVPLSYDPGQFFTLDLPIGEKRIDRWRSYTIANQFDGSNIVEFIISYKKNGLASEYFFNEINKGDTVKLKGPEGTFVLPKAKDQRIVMLAAGTGIAPFRAMLQELSSQGHSYPSIDLYFGTKTEKTILYLEELEDWAHFVERLTIHVCFSRESKIPKTKSKLNYHLGYIHPVYLSQQKAASKNTQYLICGWSAMIDESVAHLMNTMKVSREQIRYELFG